ncbi:MAG: hypothetical protein J3K34DRAFT_402952 [Monoraphidium minutum]|nr:MAG: hypothetical protein J3K34DRAFT_402952 [Monoraphidium minutum]
MALVSQYPYRSALQSMACKRDEKTKTRNGDVPGQMIYSLPRKGNTRTHRSGSNLCPGDGHKWRATHGQTRSSTETTSQITPGEIRSRLDLVLPGPRVLVGAWQPIVLLHTDAHVPRERVYVDEPQPQLLKGPPLGVAAGHADRVDVHAAVGADVVEARRQAHLRAAVKLAGVRLDGGDALVLERGALGARVADAVGLPGVALHPV